MSKKSAKISGLVEKHQGQALNAYYLAFFELFNLQQFYESHDVLEELWLADRKGPDGDFYKGLIQLAGAFVHLQKERLRPADALFGLATANLKKYPPMHEQLDLNALVEEIQGWSNRLREKNFTDNPLRTIPTPKLTPK